MIMAKADAQSPEEAESPEETAKEGPGDQEDPVELAQEVGQGLSQLADMVSKSGSPEMKQQIGQILQMYTEFVQSAMGGEGPQTQPEGQGQIPMTQGASGVPMGPQTMQ